MRLLLLFAAAQQVTAIVVSHVWVERQEAIAMLKRWKPTYDGDYVFMSGIDRYTRARIHLETKPKACGLVRLADDGIGFDLYVVRTERHHHDDAGQSPVTKVCSVLWSSAQTDARTRFTELRTWHTHEFPYGAIWADRDLDDGEWWWAGADVL